MKKPLARSCLEKIKPYVPGKPVEEVERELGLQDVCKLASNENPLGPSPRAVEAMQRQMSRLHYYPDGNCFYLKEALAAKLGVTPEHLIFGNGSDEIISLLAGAYVNSQDEAVAPQPSFSEYQFAVYLMDGILRTVDLRAGDFLYDFPAMAKAVNERTRLVFICSPNNPTGTIARRRELEAFMDRLPPQVLLVIDQAYYEYVTDPEYPDGLDYVRAGRPVVLLRTFSKIYGLAGLRIGYGIADPSIINDLNRVREPFNVNSMAQAAALAALDDVEHLAKSRFLVEKGKRQISAGLSRLGLQPVPTEANFFFIDVKKDSRQVFREMMRRGVIVRTGDIFNFPTYIRVTYGTEEQNYRFLSALAEVLNSI